MNAKARVAFVCAHTTYQEYNRDLEAFSTFKKLLASRKGRAVRGRDDEIVL